MSEKLLRRVFPRDSHHVEGLHKAIAAATPERGRVLDLGCGMNSDLARYRSRSREVWGADFHKHPELQHPRWFVPLGEEGKIPFPDGYFDTVVAVMVLEHIVDPLFFLSEVSRVLRPGGRFIGHSISGRHYITFISRLFGLLPHSLTQAIVEKLYKRPKADTFPAHYRLNSEGHVRESCASVGLSLADFERYADPGYFRFSKPIQATAILADRLLDWLCPGWGRLYFTATAEKLVGAGVRSNVHKWVIETESTPVNRVSESVR